MFSDSCLFNSSQCWNRAFDVQDASFCAPFPSVQGRAGVLQILWSLNQGPKTDTDTQPAFLSSLEATLFSRAKFLGRCVWFQKAPLNMYPKHPLEVRGQAKGLGLAGSKSLCRQSAGMDQAKGPLSSKAELCPTARQLVHFSKADVCISRPQTWSSGLPEAIPPQGCVFLATQNPHITS